MMITRALLVALFCVSTYGGTLSAANDDSECALYLSGPGRTSAYDYSINLLKGNFGYEGQTNCITYEAVNQAYLEARNRILVAQPKNDWKPEDFASVGELILDISINLARRYGLTYEEIEKGLPLIDTSRTLIREVCPPVFSHVECRAGKYRRYDGLCNNLQHPTWGATMAPFQRLIGPLFSDGINAPRISHTGHDLPLSRVVSRTMHPDDGFHDHAGTVMVIAWGQFMDHDYTLTGTPLDPINRNDPEECCKRPQHLKHPYCNEIRIPDDDYFYKLWGVKCIDFVRGFPSPRPGCRLGSRVPFNTLTGSIDGNTVYGVTEKFARKLRTGFGGLLRMNPVFKEYGLKDLLPLKLDIPDEGCTRPNKNMYCFEAGEIRVNEQLVLTVMHTLMAREHNRVAKALAEVNPHWDDETLFQEARRINIAEIQHITYNEFLPILLGKDVMEKFGLVLEKEGFWDGYDTEVNPDVLASFAAAAYRFGHSLLPTAVERWSKAHKFIASKRLSDLIRRPYDLYRAGVLDEYVMGLMNQVAQAMDDSITQEVTNHLFKKVGARFGMDLVSFNMQRGREFGLPGYMEFRKFCGLPWADDFQGLFGSMPNQTVRKYESIFEHPVDVDLWSGGVSERPLPGSMLGPTFACIIATQFSYSRRGDRFWFELPNQPSSFTPEQLVEIKKSRLARVICDNTDIIDTVQLYPMVLPDHELNPRVPCRSGIIPAMDFSKWAEPSPFQGSAKQFTTEAVIVEMNNTIEDWQKQGYSCHENRCICNGTVISYNNTTQCIATVDNKTKTSEMLVECSNSTSNECNGQTDGNPNDKDNEIPDSNTVLKYVYKKNEKPNSDEKTKGHIKNSLKRRKRSTVNDTAASPSSYKHSPLIIDYETTHRPRGKITWLTSSDNPNIIRGSDLANFNIQTTHGNLNRNAETPKNTDRQYTEADHLNDSPQTNKFNDNRISDYRKSDESDEIDKDQEDRKYSTSRKHSPPRGERYRDSPNQGRENSEPIQDSHDSRDSNDRSRESDEIDHDSNERYREIGDRSRENLESSHDKGDYNQNSRERSRDNNKNNHDRSDRYRHNEDYRRKNSKPNHHSEENNSRSRESDETRQDSSDHSHESNVHIHERGEKNRDSRENDPKIGNNKVTYSSPLTHSRESNERIDTHKPYRNNAESLENISKEDPDNTRNTNLDEVKNNVYRPEIEPYDPSPLNLPVIKLSDDKEFPHPELFTTDVKEYNSQPLQVPEVQLDKDTKLPHPESFTKDIKAFDSPPLPEIKLPNGVDFPHPESFTKDIIAFDSRPSNLKRKERIQGENGQLVATNNNNGIGDPNSAVEVLPSSIVNPKNNNPGKDTSSSIESYHNSPVSINDGEVKPVVEISGEQSDENFKTHDAENTSLESILGVTINNGLHDKLLVEKENVKQQFERIPLNYKHDVDKNKKPIKDTENVQPPKDENTDLLKNQGTVDALSPDNVKYDENLNIKFDDVTVNLPEIKLPDDILAYARENSPFKDELNDDEPLKSPFYNYDNDDNPKPAPPAVDSKDVPNNNYKKGPKSDKNVDYEDDGEEDEADHAYFGPYYEDEEKNQNYKKEEAEDDADEEEDLYEKFVRERFGKQGTFEKRSEQLREATETPLNPHLYKTIQNILNKTAQIEKQAEESGDPKAGYMWTLEYGENL